MQCRPPPKSIPAGLAEAAHKYGYDSALSVFRRGIANKAERGRGEGKLRTELLQQLTVDHEWADVSPMTVGLAVDAVMTQAFRAVALEGELF